MEEGAGNSGGDYENVMNLCREIIGKLKAQLELRLATAVKYHKKCFYKYIRNKRKAKDNLYPLLGVVRNIAEKAEVLSAFFA